MGVRLDDRGIVQVSMNLTNYEKTPMFRVFDTVQARGRALRRQRARERDRRAGAGQRAVRGGRPLPAAGGLLARAGAGEQAAGPLSRGAGMPGSRLRSSSSPRRDGRDAVALHLAVEVAALDAERLGRARHVAALGGQHAQDVVLLEALARLEQRQARPRLRRRTPPGAPARRAARRPARRSCRPAP